MIVSRIAGGMGNQLFQYAAARNLSELYQVPLLLDISYYQSNKLRKFELDYFCLPTINTNLEAVSETDFYFYQEPHFHYDNNFNQNLPANIYLYGFWQSEKYFKEIRSILLNELSIQEKYIEHLQLKASELLNQESVAVHIRRGDYQSHTHKQTHGILYQDYYIEAIELICSKWPSSVFYFFSDDIEWVKKNIHISCPHVFVSGHLTINNIEDFYLMSKCRHSIIANSTFSWWAAWLNPNTQDQTVIAPKTWLNNNELNTRDVIPEAWIKI